VALSLPGLFAPWPFRSLEQNGPALSLRGTEVIANFRSLKLLFPGTLARITVYVCLTIYLCILALEGITKVKQYEGPNHNLFLKYS